MKEEDFLKKVIEENLIPKDKIRNNIMIKRQKENFIMKKKMVGVASLILVFVLSLATFAYVEAKEYKEAVTFLTEIGVEEGMLTRNELKKVYKDIKSNSFDENVTNIVLSEVAKKMGIENDSLNTKEIYESIKTYDKFTYTKKLTSDEVKQIKAGTSYEDIIKILGSTKDIGSDSSHLLMYVVDGNKLLYLSFKDEKDICNKSGHELLNTLVNSIQDNKDKDTFNATVVDIYNNSVYVVCPTHDQFDSIYISITKDTEILFADGTKASINDISGTLTVTITGGVRESYPPQGTAKKIVIAQTKSN